MVCKYSENQFNTRIFQLGRRQQHTGTTGYSSWANSNQHHIDDITERVEVATSNGDVYFADAAVISVSLGILNLDRLHFHQAFQSTNKLLLTDWVMINLAKC